MRLALLDTSFYLTLGNRATAQATFLKTRDVPIECSTETFEAGSDVRPLVGRIPRHEIKCFTKNLRWRCDIVEVPKWLSASNALFLERNMFTKHSPPQPFPVILRGW